MSKAQLKSLQQQLITASDNQWYATTVKLADEYLTLEPQSVRAMADKGHALVKLARYDDALKMFERAIEHLDGQSPDAIYGEIGSLYRDRGDFAKAADYFERQIESDPEDGTGHLFLGTLRFQQGQLDQAEAALQAGLKCKTGCEEELRYALGCVFRGAGKLGEARAEFEAVLRINPRDVLAKNAIKDTQNTQ